MGEKNSNDVWFSSYSPPRLLISCALLGIFRIRGLNQNIILSPYKGVGRLPTYPLDTCGAVKMLSPVGICPFVDGRASGLLEVSMGLPGSIGCKAVARGEASSSKTRPCHITRVSAGFPPASFTVIFLSRYSIPVFITSYCTCASFYSSAGPRASCRWATFPTSMHKSVLINLAAMVVSPPRICRLSIPARNAKYPSEILFVDVPMPK